MTYEDLITRTENFIKTVPEIKERIDFINREIEKNSSNIEVFKKEKRHWEIKLQKLKNAMKFLDEDEQKIICYKYFEDMSNRKISTTLGRSTNYCNKEKVRGLLIRIGRLTFIGDIIFEGLEE